MSSIQYNVELSDLQTRAFAHIAMADEFLDAVLWADGNTAEVHRVILASVSPYFRTLFNSVKTDKQVVCMCSIDRSFNSIISIHTIPSIKIIKIFIETFLELFPIASFFAEVFSFLPFLHILLNIRLLFSSCFGRYQLRGSSIDHSVRILRQNYRQ